jgi:hypothetical protein
MYSAMVSPSTFQSLSCFATYLPLDEFRVWFNFIYLFYLCGEDNGNAGAGYAFMKLMTDLLLQVEWLANRVDGSCELLYILLEKLSYILTISTKNHE